MLNVYNFFPIHTCSAKVNFLAGRYLWLAMVLLVATRLYGTNDAKGPDLVKDLGIDLSDEEVLQVLNPASKSLNGILKQGPKVEKKVPPLHEQVFKLQVITHDFTKQLNKYKEETEDSQSIMKRYKKKSDKSLYSGIAIILMLTLINAYLTFFKHKPAS